MMNTTLDRATKCSCPADLLSILARVETVLFSVLGTLQKLRSHIRTRVAFKKKLYSLKCALSAGTVDRRCSYTVHHLQLDRTHPVFQLWKGSLFWESIQATS